MRKIAASPKAVNLNRPALVRFKPRFDAFADAVAAVL